MGEENRQAVSEMFGWSTEAWAALGEWAGACATILVAYLVYRWGRRERDRESIARRSGALLAWPTEEGIEVTNVGPDPVVAWSVSTCRLTSCAHTTGKHEWKTLASNRIHGPMAVGRLARVRLSPAPLSGHPQVPSHEFPLHIAFRDSRNVLWVREGEELRQEDPPVTERLVRRLRSRVARTIDPAP